MSFEIFAGRLWKGKLGHESGWMTFEIIAGFKHNVRESTAAGLEPIMTIPATNTLGQRPVAWLFRRRGKSLEQRFFFAAKARSALR